MSELNCVLQTYVNVSEIKSDSTVWSGEDVQQLDAAIVSEMIKGDENPYFVELTALHECISNNKSIYTPEAVKTCVDVMVGVNMYKGHQQPGTESWAYREPVGKIVAARLDTIEDASGKRVLAAKGKAYISEADPKLRSDIKKKLAGPVSILGDAKASRVLGAINRTITRITSLKSIDFCNPGTGGIPSCGVTAVVSEMADTSVTGTEPTENKMAKLTKEQLLTEYTTEITEIMGGRIDADMKLLADEKRAIHALKDEHATKLNELTAQVAEMKKLADDEKKRGNDLAAKLVTAEGKLLILEVEKHANAKVAEIRATNKYDARVIDLAVEGIAVSLVDNDLTKSQADYDTKFTKEVERLAKVAEMMKPAGTQTTPRTKVTSGNPTPGNNFNDRMASILNPELAKLGGFAS